MNFIISAGARKGQSSVVGGLEPEEKLAAKAGQRVFFHESQTRKGLTGWRVVHVPSNNRFYARQPLPAELDELREITGKY